MTRTFDMTGYSMTFDRMVVGKKYAMDGVVYRLVAKRQEAVVGSPFATRLFAVMKPVTK